MESTRPQGVPAQPRRADTHAHDLSVHPDPHDSRPGRGEVVMLRDGIKVSRLIIAPGRGLPPHSASQDMVVVVLRGRGRFIVDEKVRNVEAGDILDFEPDEHHAVEADEELELVLTECPRLPQPSADAPLVPR